MKTEIYISHGGKDTPVVRSELGVKKKKKEAVLQNTAERNSINRHMDF